MAPKCKKCKKRRGEYSEKWDAHFCRECNLWLEVKCSTEPGDTANCRFECWNRPERPIEKNCPHCFLPMHFGEEVGGFVCLKGCDG